MASQSSLVYAAVTSSLEWFSGLYRAKNTLIRWNFSVDDNLLYRISNGEF